MRKINMGLVAILLSTVYTMGAVGPAYTAEQLAAYAEANARISPVIIRMDVDKNARNCGFKSNEEYTVEWTVRGYEQDVLSLMSINDCYLRPSYTCGLTALDQLVFNTPYLVTEPVETDEWTYTDLAGTTVKAIEHTYSATFTMPDSGSNRGSLRSWNSEDLSGGDQVVFRWWRKKANSPEGIKGVSLVVSSEAGHQYGNNARRIESTVSVDLDPSPLNQTCDVLPPQAQP